MSKFGIQSGDVVGVATDNTAVMPKAVQHAGLSHIPCLAHVGNLMIRAIVDTFDLEPLGGLRAFFAFCHLRVRAAMEIGLAPAALLTPTHRFAFMVPALRIPLRSVRSAC